jgi:hypothetical protein
MTHLTPIHFKDPYKIKDKYVNAKETLSVLHLYGLTIKKDLTGIGPSLCSKTQIFDKDTTKEAYKAYINKYNKDKGKAPHYNYFIKCCERMHIKAEEGSDLIIGDLL